jgi:hypothetical protein
MPTKLAVYQTRQAPPAVLVGLVSGDHVVPLLAATGEMYESLFDVIEDWDAIQNAGLRTDQKGKAAIADVDILPPLTGRDVLVSRDESDAWALLTM